MTSLPGGSDNGRDDSGRDDNGRDDDDSGTKPEPLVCARCGTRAEAPQPTWTFSVENGVRHYFCDACSRENLRAIEGRLDSEWW